MATQKIPGRAIKLGNDAAGDIAYFDGAAWQRLPIGEAGQRLTMNEGGTLPTWDDTPIFQGRISGYCVGGETSGTTPVNIIDKFSYTSSVNATDVGDLTAPGMQAGCCGSNTNGYCAGGELYTDIGKFAFANESNTTDVGDLGSGLTTLRAHHASSHF